MPLAKQLGPNLYEQLLDLPENLVGEIVAGQLMVQPHPAEPHALASSSLGADLQGLLVAPWDVIYNLKLITPPDETTKAADCGGITPSAVAHRDYMFTPQ